MTWLELWRVFSGKKFTGKFVRLSPFIFAMKWLFLARLLICNKLIRMSTFSLLIVGFKIILALVTEKNSIMLKLHDSEISRHNHVGWIAAVGTFWFCLLFSNNGPVITRQMRQLKRIAISHHSWCRFFQSLSATASLRNDCKERHYFW